MPHTPSTASLASRLASSRLERANGREATASAAAACGQCEVDAADVASSSQLGESFSWRARVRHSVLSGEAFEDDGRGVIWLAAEREELSALASLAECGAGDCACTRTLFPWVRRRFRDGVTRRALMAVEQREWPADGRIHYVSFGSGLLLGDLDLIVALQEAGLTIASATFVDIDYADACEGALQEMASYLAPARVTACASAAEYVQRRLTDAEPAADLFVLIDCAEVWFVEAHSVHAASPTRMHPVHSRTHAPCALQVQFVEAAAISAIGLAKDGLAFRLCNRGVEQVGVEHHVGRAKLADHPNPHPQPHPNPSPSGVGVEQHGGQPLGYLPAGSLPAEAAAAEVQAAGVQAVAEAQCAAGSGGGGSGGGGGGSGDGDGSGGGDADGSSPILGEQRAVSELGGQGPGVRAVSELGGQGPGVRAVSELRGQGSGDRAVSELRGQGPGARAVSELGGRGPGDRALSELRAQASVDVWRRAPDPPREAIERLAEARALAMEAASAKAMATEGAAAEGAAGEGAAGEGAAAEGATAEGAAATEGAAAAEGSSAAEVAMSRRDGEELSVPDVAASSSSPGGALDGLHPRVMLLIDPVALIAVEVNGSQVRSV